MRNEVTFDELRNLNKKDEKMETVFYEPYHNIDLNKILGAQIYPDEKIVYIAKNHWIILLKAFFTFVICFITLLYWHNLIVFINPFFLLFFIGTIVFLTEYFTRKIIITNKRLIILSKVGTALVCIFKILSFKKSNKKEFFIFSDIYQIKTTEGLFGNGTLYLKHKNCPKELFITTKDIDKINDFKFYINEQLKLIDNIEYKKSDNKELVEKPVISLNMPLIIIGVIVLQAVLIMLGLSLLSKIVTICLSFRDF